MDGNGSNTIGDDNPATPLRPSLPGSSDNWEDHASALQGITREQFAGLIGTSFKIVFPAGTEAPVWVTLASVDDLPALPAVNPASLAVSNRQSSVVPATNGFSLTFTSTAELTQGPYLFEHETLGKFALFAVPSGPVAYTAVVNRLSGPTVIAVPFQTNGGSGNTGGSTVKIKAPAGVVTASPATSSDIENPSPRLSGIQGVRKGVVRD